MPVPGAIASRRDGGSATGPRAGLPLGQAGASVNSADGRPGLLLVHAATVICGEAAARGERLSQRALARQLRDHGHRFPNEDLRLIAASIGLSQSDAA